MPGPKATNRAKRPDTGSSNPKARKRLTARQEAFVETTPWMRINGLQTVKPGSENRKK